MYKIKTFNKIDNLGIKRITNRFELVNDEDYDAIILRSYKLHDTQFPQSLLCIARAGVGVNNVPIERCSKEGIVVMNTPGANSNAVKELVILGMLLSTRNVVGGIEWVKSVKDHDDVETLIEGQKSNFAGHELFGKKVGVIGLGAIGVKVSNALEDLGMDVYGYDPFLSVEAAWAVSRKVKRTSNLEWIVENCDYITIHIPLNDKTKKIFNHSLFAKAKKGIKVMNFARGGLIDNDLLKEFLDDGTIGGYVTDFPNAEIIGLDKVICIPHLGASTPESEENCAIMAVDQTMDYLLTGNIKNSVNYPTCNMGECNCKVRICINHRNIPNMVGQITTMMANANLNIENMMNKSKDENAYTMMDVLDDVPNSVIEQLRSIDGVQKVREIRKDD